jgi:hypothetical protein
MIFREGGTSTDNWQQSFKEFHQARCQVFQPEGIEQMRELRDTYLHFAKVWIYRKVLSPNSFLPVKGVTQ